MAKAANVKPAESTEKASSLTDEERAQISTLSYEQARDQLAEAVQALEAGGLDLRGIWSKRPEKLRAKKFKTPV